MRHLLLLVTFSSLPLLAACSGKGEVEISGGVSFEPGASDENGRVDAKPGTGRFDAKPGTGGGGANGGGANGGGANGGGANGGGANGGGASGGGANGGGANGGGASGGGANGGGASGGGANGGGSPINVGSGVGAGGQGLGSGFAPPDGDERNCAASCKLESQCGYAPKDCIDSCRAHNRHVRDEFLTKEAACLEAATCWEPQGACAHKAAKAIRCDYDADPMYQKCVNKRDQCGAQVRSDECARYLFLTSSERSNVDACLCQPCDAVGKCIDQILTRK